MAASRLVVISAPSGAGKTTLCLKLLHEFQQYFTLSISSTTRAPRGGEKDVRDYYFLTKEEFESRRDAGRFAEWAEVHGHFYGTSKDVIEKAFAEGKSVLLDIDVQGAASLRKAYPKESFSVFVAPPSIQVLEKRLRARKTDSEETIEKRIRNAKAEMARMNEFDSIVVNDDLDKAYAELKAIVLNALGLGDGEV